MAQSPEQVAAQARARYVPHVFGAIFAALAAGVGLVALAGWVVGHPILAAFAADRVPMAPSTAILLVLYGTALCLHAAASGSRFARRVNTVLGLAGTGASVLLLILSSIGVHPAVEHLGMRIVATEYGAPIGHMSPLTAFCLALSGASFLALVSSLPARRGWVVVAFGLACLVASTGAVLLLAYLFGSPALYGTGAIPPAMPTGLALLMLGASLLAASGVVAWLPSGLSGVADRRALYLLVLIFVMLAAGIVAAGYFYYQRYSQHHRAEVERHLLAVADLKTHELMDWREERLANAAVFFKNDAFAALVRRHFDTPDDVEAKKDLGGWLGQFEAHMSCDRLMLLDAHGVERMAFPEKGEPHAAHLATDAAKTLRTGKMTFLDFHRDGAEGPVHLAILVPIFGDRDGKSPLGVLILRIDPETYLYPFISRWPTSSRTAETLIVRREGDDAVFLNELRFRKNTALLHRTPLTRTERPAVKAVLGQQGIVDGVDYRGVPVVAALRAVPNSPWFLVARMDVSEVCAPLTERMWLTVVLIGVLLLAAGAGVGLVWRQHSVCFYREKAEVAEGLRASEVRYRRLFEAARDGILILDAKMGLVVDVNPFLVEMLGFSREHFLEKKVWELGFFGDAIASQANFTRLQEVGYVRYEDMPLRAADGRRIDVEFVSNVYEVNGRRVIQCNIRDTTERRRAAAAILQKSEELARANDELTRFTYTVSHDLKSPVVTIRTFLGYLEKDTAGRDTERMGKDVGYIRTAAEKMSRMLDELLELSRIGRKVNPFVDAPLQAVVKDALDLVAGQIAERGVRVDVTAEPILLHGDRPRLVEVFQNLLDNAVKFMGDQPAPRIEVGVEQACDETLLFVRDNGIGIDPRHQPKLFGLFEKLDPRTDGTGMGLAIVRRVVEVHGGSIWVESAGPGKGATFRFTLANTRRQST
ncbi:MAG: ATP-binding protein [Phycisphaerae bacterium]|nr:ATP-binding protein [Phycisphaerae bacterium]